MSANSRWIAILVIAFVITLAGIRFLNRDKPVVAFKTEETIHYDGFWAFPFAATEPVNLEIEVKSSSGFKYNVVILPHEEFEYFLKVNSGELPRERHISLTLNSFAGTNHRFPPTPFQPGDYVFFIENNHSSNSKKLPLKISIKALESPLD